MPAQASSRVLTSTILMHPEMARNFDDLANSVRWKRADWFRVPLNSGLRRLKKNARRTWIFIY